ncbi:MAG: hypothetical protein OXF75_11310 [Acidimicrobiaceae bacterium]|nr:hypothetical protein [Acidimicrobiaceae bacterium]
MSHAPVPYAPPAGPRPRAPVGFASDRDGNYARVIAPWRDPAANRRAFVASVGARAASSQDAIEAFRRILDPRDEGGN